MIVNDCHTIKVNVAAVHDVVATRFIINKIQPIHIVHTGWCNMRKNRDGSSDIQ
ncbi:hypothetical protein SAMN05444410_106159 [Hydrobacter penzbergensis]|uniref:Uncharacterized protein n=1 Tax=Hydrobacter penzbergensis TaxID=1235997 RepID=A0A8X8ICA2_9BACT|nr:hypothetical protein SAMN05444410_106159 [Hydrobacter penzbergensis]